MNAIETTKSAGEFRNVALGELSESTTNPHKTFDEASLDELARASVATGCSRPWLCGAQTDISKSSRERGTTGRRSGRALRNFPCACWNSLTVRPRNCKSSNYL